MLTGIASVTLSNGTMSIRDAQGRDLLSPTSPETNPQPSAAELSKAQADIAALFGFGGEQENRS